MNLLILGINHQIQRPFWSSRPKDMEFVRQQKTQYAQLLAELIREHLIQFVGEEANRNEASIAKGVCEEENCCYLNIEMTAEQRIQQSIPNQYNESKTISNDEKARGNREREEHMVNEVLVNAQPTANVLVICGHMHSDALAERFRADGYSVQIDDLERRTWYVEDWWDHFQNDW